MIQLCNDLASNKGCLAPSALAIAESTIFYGTRELAVLELSRLLNKEELKHYGNYTLIVLLGHNGNYTADQENSAAYRVAGSKPEKPTSCLILEEFFHTEMDDVAVVAKSKVLNVAPLDVGSQKHRLKFRTISRKAVEGVTI
ncbi:hypothetical protein SELMODRAFT_420362 [Selaginella moellendorffii]|uniref:Uncharacterized protein n=1 Tax=Selaginella moellendorffii TaxID=88036 RepID=D8SBR6_SELML|nr:hypothetical protein SELMODRAFT_420362 [Selaginella moellendorffii]